MEVNSPVISFRSNAKRSSAVCLDVKGIQAGWSGELDKLYFLKYKARLKKKKKVKNILMIFEGVFFY